MRILANQLVARAKRFVEMSHTSTKETVEITYFVHTRYESPYRMELLFEMTPNTTGTFDIPQPNGEFVNWEAVYNYQRPVEAIYGASATVHVPINMNMPYEDYNRSVSESLRQEQWPWVRLSNLKAGQQYRYGYRVWKEFEEARTMEEFRQYTTQLAMITTPDLHGKLAVRPLK
ncbi:hypothetical protein ACIRSS_23930 [Amycolatopsis sp. NPDC101161]|uniref:hypothetical protein n=1 Tax=Amycolatopsis sp. NPDC101161 TaxID=3363940 RepID=UPI0037F84857